MKKVLITSGGTKIPIDRVRSITNMSRGTFGSKIANAFKFCEHISLQKLDFLMAKGSRFPTPTTENILCEDIQEYVTFDDYKRELFRLIEENNPDIIVLAAAVSDYGVDNYVDGKMKSADDMIIKLKPLPKLISSVREAAPDAFICGFKLLVDSTDHDLRAAMVKSFEENKLNLVVGNDLRDIKNNDHRLTLYDGKDFSIKTKQEHVLEIEVVKACIGM